MGERLGAPRGEEDYVSRAGATLCVREVNFKGP